MPERVRQCSRMGGLHLLSKATAEDVSIVHAVQGDTTQANSGKAVIPMS